MKKILALVAVALVSIAGAFALDLKGIEGTWQDKTYDADWTFRADGHIILKLSSTGEEIFDFNDSNISNFKVSGSLTSGVTISFDCAATHRSYKFTKPASLDTSLSMVVNPDWSATDYSTKITFKK